MKMSGNGNLEKTYTSDKKMLLLIEILKAYGKIRFKKEFCDSIGIRKQNLLKVERGLIHFTPEHIENAIKVFKVDANWIFGIGDNIFIGYKKGHINKKSKLNINSTV